MEIIFLLLSLLGFVVLFIVAWIFDPVLHIFKAKKATAKDGDHNLYTGKTLEKVKQSELIINSSAAVDVTLIVPAFNEELRIKNMLEPAFEFLDEWSREENLAYEIIVVDDKSTDKTVEVVRNYMREYGDLHQIRLLELCRNFGKGGAVKQGVKRARGKFVLMVDADGATEITDLRKLFAELKAVMKPSKVLNDYVGVAIGSRAHMRELNAKQKRSLLRNILTQGFHFLVGLLCTKNVRDTQCGFKLFTRQSARVLFSNLHLESWAFDIELIYLAEAMNFPIVEIAVTWNEVDGSKLIQSKMDIVTTSLAMARDMLCVRIAYLIGVWGYTES